MILLFLVLGRKIDMNIFDLVKMMRAEKSEYLKLMAKNKISMEELPLSPDIGKMALAFNKPELQRVEIPSANCHGSARGMAKLASIMANLGKYPSSGDNKDEKSLMSHETWKKMHEGEKLSVDANLIGSSAFFQLIHICNNNYHINLYNLIFHSTEIGIFLFQPHEPTSHKEVFVYFLQRNTEAKKRWIPWRNLFVWIGKGFTDGLV